MHGHIPENSKQIVEQVKNDVKFRTISLRDIVKDPINCLVCHNWVLSFA